MLCSNANNLLMAQFVLRTWTEEEWQQVCEAANSIEEKKMAPLKAEHVLMVKNKEGSCIVHIDTAVCTQLN